jgi:hypothetical protein
MAAAWIGLCSGRAQPADVVLLEHELAECHCLKEYTGSTYQGVRGHVNESANWDRVKPAADDEDYTVNWK